MIEQFLSSFLPKHRQGFFSQKLQERRIHRKGKGKRQKTDKGTAVVSQQLATLAAACDAVAYSSPKNKKSVVLDATTS